MDVWMMVKMIIPWKVDRFWGINKKVVNKASGKLMHGNMGIRGRANDALNNDMSHQGSSQKESVRLIGNEVGETSLVNLQTRKSVW